MKEKKTCSNKWTDIHFLACMHFFEMSVHEWQYSHYNTFHDDYTISPNSKCAY